MNRREFLVVTGVASVAGCAGGGGGDASGGGNGGGGGGDGGRGADESTPEPEPTATPTATATPTPSTPTHEIGEQFTVGDGPQTVQYTVNGVSTAQEVGPDISPVEADGTFLLVDVTMENTGDESFNASSNIFTALNAQDQEYDVDTEALVYLDDGIAFEQLNPGLSTDGSVVFDVPSGEYRLRIEPVGVFSGARPHLVGLGSV